MEVEISMLERLVKSNASNPSTDDSTFCTESLIHAKP
jgi:hypothetical protein